LCRIRGLAVGLRWDSAPQCRKPHRSGRGGSPRVRWARKGGGDGSLQSCSGTGVDPGSCGAGGRRSKARVCRLLSLLNGGVTWSVSSIQAKARRSGWVRLVVFAGYHAFFLKRSFSASTSFQAKDALAEFGPGRVKVKSPTLIHCESARRVGRLKWRCATRITQSAPLGRCDSSQSSDASSEIFLKRRCHHPVMGFRLSRMCERGQHVRKVCQQVCIELIHDTLDPSVAED